MNQAYRGYKGNPNLKQLGEEIQFTGHQALEIAKCSRDPIYFLETYGKIVAIGKGVVPFKLFSYQKRFIKAITENRKVIGKIGRQMGKSTIVAGYYAWFCLFNPNTTSALLANKLAVAKEIFGRVQFIIENCPKWLQQGICEWNKTSLELENGARVFCSATSPSAVRGFSCVSGDTLVTIQTDSGSIYTIPIDQVSTITSEENSMTKKFYIVYKITNLLNDKIYVGYHSTNKLDDGYMGSGSLITKAIEKYGVDNFKKEILYIFNNKEEAELVESIIVDAEFVKRTDVYNITTGGNVTTLPGDKNGFYNKRHSNETRELLKLKKIGYTPMKFITYDGVKLASVIDVLNYFNIDSSTLTKSRYRIPRKTLAVYKLIIDNKVAYISDVYQQRAIQKYNDYLHWVDTAEERKINTSNVMSQKLSGVKKSDTARQNMSDARIKYLEDNAEEHYEKMLRINKDPEKIRKTAEKHRGMKRSDETRKKMSDAKKGKAPWNKGKSKKNIGDSK